jgi:hypothetical protein
MSKGRTEVRGPVVAVRDSAGSQESGQEVLSRKECEQVVASFRYGSVQSLHPRGEPFASYIFATHVMNGCQCAFALIAGVGNAIAPRELDRSFTTNLRRSFRSAVIQVCARRDGRHFHAGCRACGERTNPSSRLMQLLQSTNNYARSTSCDRSRLPNLLEICDSRDAFLSSL